MVAKTQTLVFEAYPMRVEQAPAPELATFETLLDINGMIEQTSIEAVQNLVGCIAVDASELT